MMSFWIWAVLGICLYFFIRIQRPKNFPPGPKPVPIFGNLFQFNINNPLQDFERLAERFGIVYSLYIGRRPAVVLNGLKAIKEALVTKSVDFSGRPDNLLVSHMTEKKGVVMADYGPGWRAHRRFDLMTLRNFGMGKQSMETRILAEIEHMVARLEKNVGSTMNPQTLFHDAASNIIYLVLISTRYDYEDKTLKEYVRMFVQITKMLNGPWGMIYDTLPVVRYLPLPFKKAFATMAVLKQKAADMINKHKSTRVPGQPRDFVDCYLDEINKGIDGSSFNEMQLVMHLLDLHVAGTDTTANTLLTAFLYLITHPDVQEKCQQEIDEVLDGKVHVSFEDRHNMPYTQAVIHECQRVARTGTLIITNLSSVLSEEGQWKFPQEFNPSNFLNEQGQFEKPEAFLPFSAGTPDFTPVYGITLTPKPYEMGIKLRRTAQEMQK
ncbi:Cytochrome P450 2J5 [Bagarius yarrelli]|uniref:Cytochrome P450 2J5 n=1 Tax=Bagarius yarrelli TaxID=175774 RepID=A0A556TYP2_BAGYA|nr:Cytochrome P450 2J5 [Bagarius yarrelli]